jgi:hypothetical protein
MERGAVRACRTHAEAWAYYRRAAETGLKARGSRPSRGQDHKQVTLRLASSPAVARPSLPRGMGQHRRPANPIREGRVTAFRLAVTEPAVNA